MTDFFAFVQEISPICSVSAVSRSAIISALGRQPAVHHVNNDDDCDNRNVLLKLYHCAGYDHADDV